MFWIYAIYNTDHNKIYIGQTSDLQIRLSEHNDPHNTRHHYTKSFSGNWDLIYSETTEDRTEALKREKKLKSFRGREFVKRCIPKV